MKSSIYQSPDGLIQLRNEPTITINRDHPAGFEDWIIELTPGGWHTHPKLLSQQYSLPPEQATARFIAEILNDNRPLALRYRDHALREVSALDVDHDSLEIQLEHLNEHMSIDERVVIRTWSGAVLHEICPLPGRIVTNRADIHRLYNELESLLNVPPQQQRVETKPMRCFVCDARRVDTHPTNEVDLAVLDSLLCEDDRAIFFREVMYIHDADYPFSIASRAEIEAYYAQGMWQHDDYIFEPQARWCLMITHDDEQWLLDHDEHRSAKFGAP